MIGRAALVAQPLARRALLVRERISFEQGNRRISVEPSDHYEIDCLIDFPHPLIRVQQFSLQLTNGAFSREAVSCGAQAPRPTFSVARNSDHIHT